MRRRETSTARHWPFTRGNLYGLVLIPELPAAGDRASLGQDCQMQHVIEDATSALIPMVTMAHHLEIVHSLENTVVDLREVIAELTVERILNRGRSH